MTRFRLERGLADRQTDRQTNKQTQLITVPIRLGYRWREYQSRHAAPVKPKDTMTRNTNLKPGLVAFFVHPVWK